MTKGDEIVEAVGKEVIQFDDNEIKKLQAMGWTSVEGMKVINEHFMKRAIRLTASKIKKEVFDKMVDMEVASHRNPNLLQTYEVMWNNLKNKLQFEDDWLGGVE